MNRKLNVQSMVGLAMLTAIVVVLQVLGSFIKLGPFSITLVLMPIVLGASLYGVGAGAWLGLVFGVVVLMSGDAAAFYVISPFGTILTVLAKGTLAGAAAGLVFRLVRNKNEMLAVALASIVCPIVNTGVFYLGCFAFFLPALREWAVAWASESGHSSNVLVYMLLGLAGANFIAEFVSNILLNPPIHRLLKILKRNGI